MQSFASTQEVVEHIVSDYRREAPLILVRRETFPSSPELFSEVCLEVYASSPRDTHLEFIRIGSVVCLLLIEFFVYHEGEHISPPPGVRVVFGTYTDATLPDRGTLPESPERFEKLQRRKMIRSFCKHLSRGDDSFLEDVERYF